MVISEKTRGKILLVLVKPSAAAITSELREHNYEIVFVKLYAKHEEVTFLLEHESFCAIIIAFPVGFASLLEFILLIRNHDSEVPILVLTSNDFEQPIPLMDFSPNAFAGIESLEFPWTKGEVVASALRIINSRLK